MKNVTDIDNSSKTSRGLGMFVAMWRGLIEPSPSIVEPERRLQARLLMAMLLVLVILGLLSVILTLVDLYARSEESLVITPILLWTPVAGVLLLAVEYGLSRTVHYRLAAVLAISTVLSATFMAEEAYPRAS